MTTAPPTPADCDVAIVGAGAAGLATAFFAAESSLRILLLDAAVRPGAKILVSGGSRCNVSNVEVTERDFHGRRPVIRRVLRGFPVPDTIAWFRSLGVPLHVEAGGKLFPDSNRSRDVLEALMRAVTSRGVRLLAGARVNRIAPSTSTGFTLHTAAGPVTSRRVVLATGGQSLPKSGSDGSGYGLASALGHAVVPTTPALVPLVLDDREPALHRQLSGVSADVELVLRLESRVASRVRGAMLFTHFGISGPATLDISREWARAALERRDARLSASFIPGERLETLEPRWLALGRERPGTSVRSVLATSLPASLAQALLAAASIPTGVTITQLTREARRRLIDAVLDWPLPVTGTRGYTYAETTAGGVDLSEIDPGTMASRRCPGLYLVGELLDVDGRIGGFNFQWAWASGRAAGAALARAAAQ